MYGFLSVVVALFLTQNSQVYSFDGIPGDNIPGKIRSGFSLKKPDNDEILEHNANLAKAKLSKSLRHTVPVELVLRSGFIPGEQDPLEMAGCYIRLGSNLRSYKLATSSGDLAATSFLDAGLLYAAVAWQVEDVKIRTDLLTSAAQCYYWSFCNESLLGRKSGIKKLATNYFDWALEGSALLGDEAEKITLINKIEMEKSKLANRG